MAALASLEALEGLGLVIPVQPQPEPTAPDYDFKDDVYERGRDAIRQLRGQPPLKKRPGRKIEQRVERITPAILRKYNYWTRAMDALHEAYGGYCAYQARYLERADNPTTDHFVALENAGDPQLAYTWSNFRLACTLANSWKSTKTVLDPFEIKDGWFALDLGDFKTIVGPNAPTTRHKQIQQTIEHLGLDREDVALMRRRAADSYLQPRVPHKPVPLWSLEVDHPFLARELRRQNRLRPEDM